MSNSSEIDVAFPPRRNWRPSTLIRLSFGVHAIAGGIMLVSPEEWPRAVGALALDHFILTAQGMWPKSRLLGLNWQSLPPSVASPGRVALTFDDGPDPDVTPRVLDLLEAASATATFFCIGQRVREHPRLVREIVARGHTVENHSQHHRLGFAFSSIRGFVKEIGEAQATIADVTGRRPRFFRAPFGIRNPLLEPALAELGLELVSWTRRGYDTREKDPNKVLRRLVRGLDDGDILLLHDGHAARTHAGEPQVQAVLPDLLKCLRTAGLRGIGLNEGIPTLQ